ncbi:hypothetical protein NUSPORA_02333 [Nucleospora cyclopteri]
MGDFEKKTSPFFSSQSDLAKLTREYCKKDDLIFIDKQPPTINFPAPPDLGEKKHQNPFKEQIPAVQLIDIDQPETRSKIQKIILRKTQSSIGSHVLSVKLKNDSSQQTIKSIPVVPLHKFPTLFSGIFNEIFEFFIKLEPQREITDISCIVLQVCKTQEGSRFIQQQFDSWSESNVDEFLDLIKNSINDLSINLFGNYIIQKIIKKGQEDKVALIKQEIKGQIVELSLNMYGCRVIQEYLNRTNDVVFIADEIKNQMAQLVCSPFGNHVIQKCLDFKYAQDVFIVEFQNDCVIYGKEKYGCRIIQCIFEKVEARKTKALAYNLLSNANELVDDQYGNYVMQFLIKEPEYKSCIVDYVTDNCRELCLSKFSSNIVEKCVDTSDQTIINQFFKEFSVEGPDGLPFLITMLRDGCANYVVQSLYSNASESKKNEIEKVINENYEILKSSPYVKYMKQRISQNKHN